MTTNEKLIICPQCELEFTKKYSIQKYCSKKCSLRSKSNRHYAKYGRGTSICIRCNITYIKTNDNQKFCSRECSAKAQVKFLDIPDCIEGANRKLDKNIGYVRLYCPMHPEANTWGYVYEHRVIAEQIIGRRLLPNEIVHHKNGKRWDNSPDNLEVMDKIEHGKLNGQREEDLDKDEEDGQCPNQTQPTIG